MKEEGIESREWSCGSNATWMETDANMMGAMMACAGAAMECAATQSRQCDSLCLLLGLAGLCAWMSCAVANTTSARTKIVAAN